MTYKTITTIYNTLKDELDRTDKQYWATNSAFHKERKRVDDYIREHPEANQMLSDFVLCKPISDMTFDTIYQRYLELKKINRQLEEKRTQLEDALCDFNEHNW